MSAFDPTTDGGVPQLTQARAAEGLQIILPIGVLLDGQLACDPGERNIGLHAAKLLECGRGYLGSSGHAGGGGEHAMGTGKVATLPNAFLSELDGLVVVMADELNVGRDSVIDG